MTWLILSIYYSAWNLVCNIVLTAVSDSIFEYSHVVVLKTKIIGTPGYLWAFFWGGSTMWILHGQFPVNVHEPRVLPIIILNYYHNLYGTIKKCNKTQWSKNITDSPLGLALILIFGWKKGRK